MLIRYLSWKRRPPQRLSCRTFPIEGAGYLQYEGIYREARWLFDIPDDGWDHLTLVLDGQVSSRPWPRPADSPAPQIIEISDVDMDIADPPVAVEDGRLQRRWFDEGTDQSVWDVIVVGTGMGGGVLQWSLATDPVAPASAQRRLDVLGLEAGSMLFPTHVGNLPRVLYQPAPNGATSLWNTYPLFASQPYDFDRKGQSDDKESNTHEPMWMGREMFAFGGRALFWGGLCPRISETELSRWPTSVHSDLLQTYYQKAEDLLGVAPQKKGSDLERDVVTTLGTQLGQRKTTPAPVAVPRPRRNSGVVPSGMFSTAELLLEQRLSRACDQGRKYGRPYIHLAKLVTGLDRDGDLWRVRGVDLRDGAPVTHHARNVVLCAGTIETPRIVRASSGAGDLRPTGDDLVGVGLTEHPMAYVHFQLTSDNDLARPGQAARLLSVPDPAAPGPQQDWNIQIVLGSDFDEGRALPPGLQPSQTEVSEGAIAGQLVYMGRTDLTADSVDFGSPPWLDVDLPADWPSLPSATLKIDESERQQVFDELVEHWQPHAASILHTLGATALPGDSGDAGRPALQLLPAKMAWVAHETGTMRMEIPGANGFPDRPGVVDDDLQVIGCPGLYVCDNSVFPTSPAANPSLTLAALALRLADHLADQCAQPTGQG